MFIVLTRGFNASTLAFIFLTCGFEPITCE